MYEWTDPDCGTVWQMYYDVPQSGDSRECVMYRVKGTNDWHELPPFATPPQEAMELWHGTVMDGRIHDDLNDLLGVAYRLISDAKRLGVIDKAEDWRWESPL